MKQEFKSLKITTKVIKLPRIIRDVRLVKAFTWAVMLLGAWIIAVAVIKTINSL